MDPAGQQLTSLNPADGQAIASVGMATVATYHSVAEQATQAFRYWRTVPAPVRGQVVRDLVTWYLEHPDGVPETYRHDEADELTQVIDYPPGRRF